MEIELTVRDVVDAWPSLRALAARPLKTAPAFWLGRQIKRIKVTYETYEETRSELVRELGEIVDDKGNPDENGKEWRLKARHEHEYARRIKELLDVKVTEQVEPRSVASLKLDEIEPAIIANSWFLWTDEEPPEPEPAAEEKGKAKK